MELNKTTSIRLQKRIYDQVKEISEREKRSVNQIINILIDEGLKNNFGNKEQ